MIFYTIFTFFLSFIIIFFSKIKKNGIFYPPIFFSFLVILGFVIPIPFIIELKELNPFYLFWNYTYTNFEKSIINAEIAAILSLVFFCIGFKLSLIGIKKDTGKLKKNNFLIDSNVFNLFFFIFLFISLVSLFFIIIKFGGLSSFFSGNENRVKTLEGMNIVALVQVCFSGLFISWCFINKNSFFTLKFWLFFILTLFFLLLNNSKAPIFVLFTSVFIIYYYYIKRVRLLALLIGSFSFIFVFIFWELLFREYFVLGEFASYNSNDSILQNLSFKFGEFFTGNFMQVQTVSIIMDSFPSNFNFFYGSSILMIFYLWIPRFFFPNKPLTGAGEFTLTLWPDKYLHNGATLPPGLIGELYLNFSWYGIVFGMLIIGFTYGYYWKKFAINKNNDFVNSIFFVILISLMIHFFRGELCSPLLLSIFFIVPAIFLKKFIYFND